MFIPRSIALGLTCALLAPPVAGAQASPGLQTNPMSPPTISTYSTYDRPTSAPLVVDDSGSDWPMTTLVVSGLGVAALAVALGAATRGRRKIVAPTDSFGQGHEYTSKIIA